MLKHLKKTHATIATGALLWATQIHLALAQVMPSVPMPSGVASASNPIDSGVNLMKYAMKYGFVAIGLIALLIAGYFGIPVIMEWTKGKRTAGEAIGTMVMLLIAAVFATAIATFGFNQVV